MTITLTDLRAEWEKGLEEVAKTGDGKTLLVVARKPAGSALTAYYCLRYFVLPANRNSGDRWQVSMDHRLVGADDALKWLADMTVPH